jgi:hypothetical protein
MGGKVFRCRAAVSPGLHGLTAYESASMAMNWSQAGSVSRGEAVDRAHLTAIEQVSPAPGQLRRIPEVAAAMSQVGECHRITGEDSSTSRCTCAPSTSCRGCSTRHRAPASTTGIGPGTRSLRLVLPVAMATSNVALSSETEGTRSQAGEDRIRIRIREYAFQAGCREFESRLPLATCAFLEICRPSPESPRGTDGTNVT